MCFRLRNETRWPMALVRHAFILAPRQVRGARGGGPGRQVQDASWEWCGGMSERKPTALVVMRPGEERELAIRALDAMGIGLLLADEPYQATSVFHDHVVNLIVLSIDRLVESDHGFLLQVRRKAPHVRVLLLVPEGRREDAVGFLAAGADSMLKRPYLIDEFRLVATALLRTEASDPLTGLPNRPSYEAFILREISRTERSGESLALGILDVDHFGKANQALGFSRADRVLVEIADRIRRATRSSDFAARWGGEEFVGLITGLPENEAKARQLACAALNRVRRDIEETAVSIDDGTIRPVTISGGLALFPHESSGRDRDEHGYLTAKGREQAAAALFKLANERLKLAKQYRNCIACQDEDENEKICPHVPVPKD